jgi:hypothetical protein
VGVTFIICRIQDYFVLVFENKDSYIERPVVDSSFPGFGMTKCKKSGLFPKIVPSLGSVRALRKLSDALILMPGEVI